MPPDDLARRVNALERAVFGDGRSGLAAEFKSFTAVWEAREEDKKIYDDRQQRRVTTLLAVVGVLIALASAIIALLLYEHETHTSLLHLHPTHAVTAVYARPKSDSNGSR